MLVWIVLAVCGVLVTGILAVSHLNGRTETAQLREEVKAIEHRMRGPVLGAYRAKREFICWFETTHHLSGNLGNYTNVSCGHNLSGTVVVVLAVKENIVVLLPNGKIGKLMHTPMMFLGDFEEMPQCC